MVLQKSSSYQKAIEGLTLALLFALPLAQVISSVVVGLLLLASLFGFFTGKASLRMPLQWFLPTLFLYFLASEILSGGTWSSIEKRLLFIILPVVFAVNAGIFDSLAKHRIYLFCVIGNVFAVLVCLVRAFTRSFTLNAGNWEFNPNVVKDTGQDFLTSSVMEGNYFFSLEFSPFIDPAYFGMFIVFAQYLIFEIVKSSTNRRQNLWLVAGYFVLVIALFLLSSKAVIISSLFLTLYIAFHVAFRLTASPAVRLAVIAGALAGILILFFNPRIQVFKNTFWSGLTINANARFGHDLRILSWDASLDIIKENWLLGVGEGKKEAALVERYTAKGYAVPAERKYNSHNQYLDLLLGGGILGFGVFMVGFGQLIVRSIKEGNHPLLAFCLIFSFSALFENLLSRYAGVLFFSVLICLLSTRPENKP